MKKIGILFGQENSFPQAFIDAINSRGEKDIVAEFVKLDKLEQASDSGYAVIVDRISQDVPFYRAYLKNAALMGTAIINNPFWWSADEKFFNNCLAVKLGVPVPKTFLLPSNERPDDTNENSFRNMIMPLDWEAMFAHIGFPAYMKPHDGGGWKSVYKVHDANEFFEKHQETGQLVMLLQEEITFTEYYRCYCVGGKHVKIMKYEPRNPHHLRYQAEWETADPKTLETITDYTLRLNQGLGYDFNTVEFAVRDGIPYAIDFCNPAPDSSVESVGQENFDWVVNTMADYAIERAKAQNTNQDNLSWGNFISQAVGKSKTPAKKTTAKKVAKSAKQV
ncbi:MAG: hypothetical protein V4620_02490 [Bacteroidota bacterium]